MTWNPYDWFKYFCNLYMTAIYSWWQYYKGMAIQFKNVIETNLLIGLYKLFLHFSWLKQLYISNKKECFSYRGCVAYAYWWVRKEGSLGCRYGVSSSELSYMEKFWWEKFWWIILIKVIGKENYCKYGSQ